MSILDQIVASKRQEIERSKSALPLVELAARLKDAPAVRDFFAPLAAGGPIKLIAEVKKASPSKGIIRADFDPVAIARTYEAHGASGLSVLTDEPFFQGRLDYLRQVREAVSIPVVASGGAGKPEHLADAVLIGKASAALAASIFHFGEYTIRQTKEMMAARGIVVRL